VCGKTATTLIRVHRGFYEYQAKLNDCVNTHRRSLAAQGIQIDYIAGHSLGGAAATIYSEIHGNPAMQGVWTFGAPKTRAGASCSVPGKRIANTDDTIASSIMGIFSDFNHDIGGVTSVYEITECVSEVWGFCVKRQTVQVGFNSEACATESGGCNYIVDCAMNFASAHTTYGDFFF
jgi:hypothetical protein